MIRHKFIAILALATMVSVAAKAEEPEGETAAAVAATPSPAPVRVQAKVEAKPVTIGEPFRYTVSVTARKGVELVLPVLGGQLGEFTIVDFGDLERSESGESVTLSRWYALTAWEVGERKIPKPAAAYRGEGDGLTQVEGEETSIVVQSLLGPNPDAAQLADISPPEDPPIDWRPYGFLGAILALLAAVGAGLYWFLNRPREGRAIPARPAHEVALEALTRLRGQKLIEDGKFEEYYVELSNVVRRYLEDGFGLRAPEMTTEEFLTAASGDRRLGANQRRALAEFLSQADLVKFAKFMPAMRDAETAYDAAKRFVEETRPLVHREGEATHAAK